MYDHCRGSSAILHHRLFYFHVGPRPASVPRRIPSALKSLISIFASSLSKIVERWELVNITLEASWYNRNDKATASNATLANWPAFTKGWKSFEIVTRHLTCIKTSFVTFRFSHRWKASANPRCFRCSISVPYPHVTFPSDSPFSPPQRLTQSFMMILRFTWLYTEVLSKWSKLKSSTYSVGEGLFIFSCGYLLNTNYLIIHQKKSYHWHVLAS